jgi:hypothetical protein
LCADQKLSKGSAVATKYNPESFALANNTAVTVSYRYTAKNHTFTNTTHAHAASKGGDSVKKYKYNYPASGDKDRKPKLSGGYVWQPSEAQ